MDIFIFYSFSWSAQKIYLSNQGHCQCFINQKIVRLTAALRVVIDYLKLQVSLSEDFNTINITERQFKYALTYYICEFGAKSTYTYIKINYLINFLYKI